MHGKKFDSGKPDWSLLPLRLLDPIVKVLDFGAKKYARDNWKLVPDAENRYFAATMRHLQQYQSGESTDSESGLPHLAHAACCILFLLWFDYESKLPERQKTPDKDNISDRRNP